MIEAVGGEAHGSGGTKLAQPLVGLLPDPIASPLMQKAGVDQLATHHMPLDKAPQAYETFQKKQDAAVKIVFTP